MNKTQEEQDWLGVIARCLAFLCQAQADVGDKTVLTKAKLLERLGLPRNEAARILGTTEASIRELFRQASHKKEGKGDPKKKAKR